MIVRASSVVAFATLDLSADPWGVAMIVAIGIAAVALLWWLVAMAMRQPARGSGRLLSLGLFAYLSLAVGSTLARVWTPPPAPPTPAPTGPATIVRAEVPPDSQGPGKRGIETPPVATPPAAALATGTAPQPSTPVPAEPPPVELGPPTLQGKAALRFVDDVSHDEARCRDADAVGKAARELPGMTSEVPRDRAEKAAAKLEACRRKLVWTRAAAIRRHRIGDRDAWAEAAPKRFKTQGLSVLVLLRGPSHERVRIGGGSLDDGRAKSLLDGGLRDELADLGFTEVVLANMRTEMREQLAGPTDIDLAERELAPLGLAHKLSLP